MSTNLYFSQNIVDVNMSWESMEFGSDDRFVENFLENNLPLHALAEAQTNFSACQNAW